MPGSRFVGRATFVVWLVLGLLATKPVRAEKLALGDVHSESDVADEAGAVTLLVRTALVGSDRTLLGAPPGFRVADPATLQKVGADHAVAMEMSREGTGLRVTIVIVSATPSEDPDVSYVRAGDGDLQALAKGIAEKITTKLKLEPGKVPAGALGQLRPFARAIRLKPKDPPAAATELADVTTRTTPPPAQVALQGLPALVTSPQLATLAARGIGDLQALDKLAAGTDGTANAARAFAAFTRVELSKADEALASAPVKDGLVALGRVMLAEARADDKALADRIKDGLATDQQRAVLAFASTITPTRLGAPAHKSLIALAEKSADISPGVATRIGLAAAEQGVEVTRSLGLVSVRELDEPDLERLAPFLAKDDASPTILRLKAELAMRRGDGSEAVAVAAFLRADDKDPRAHRYQGWVLSAEGRYAEAAVELGKAGAKREQARALLAANDMKAALAALERAAETPEELIIEARAALVDKQVDIAEKKISLAELEAPANPVVHVAILDLTKQKPDAVRSKISRLIAEKGVSLKTDIPDEPVEKKIDLTAGSGSGATDDVEVRVPAGAKVLEPLVAALSDMQRLTNAKLRIVEQRWSPGLLAFRKVDSEPVRDALSTIVRAAPYKLKVVLVRTYLEDGELGASQLAAATGTDDAVLVYRVQPAGSAANITLTLHVKGSNTAAVVDRTVEMPGVVTFNKVKLYVVIGTAALLVLVLVLWLTRAMGRVTVQYEKSADIADEVLCVQITKTPDRPAIPDETTFFHDTRKAGTITKKRFATLITNGQKFRIPAGNWYVHLYGAYLRGGQIRKVPDTCTQPVELRRGDAKTLAFDLASKFAEVRVVIESEPKQGHAVWANNDEHKKIFTDDAGEAVLMLPIGGHVINVEAQGIRLKKQIHLASIKIERLPFNVARELRIAGDRDLASDDAVATVSQPIPVNEMVMDAAADIGLKMHANPASKIAADKTVALADTTGGPSNTSARGDQPGDMLLGRYRIVAELGRGAMGVVRRAWDEKLEREVAIKEMAEDLKKNAEAMRLFTQEAKALAQLNHTNIVAMYDQVTDTDRVYMIMEYVDGKPLEALLEEREGAIPWREAVGIVDQVLMGLAYAHARKVIHRDIKPANIFLSNDGVVKIGDFGLARVLREVTIRKTEIRGTPLYMAPEQITGTNVDHRADLYAVGCTLFELVTGRPPHIDGDILYAQLHSKPPEASTLVQGLPPVLDAVIAKLIAKKSDERYASANDVRAALRNLGPA